MHFPNFAVLFDGPSGEQGSAQDGGLLDSLGLGEKEIQLVEKFLKIVRANPEKAETRYGKFEKMVEEEEKVRDGTSAQLMRIRQPPLMKRKRSTEKKVKMGKKKKRVSKQKKVDNTKKKDQNGKKRKRVKSKDKKINEKRKLGKMGKHITNNKNNNKLERKTQKKIKLISKMKKKKQKRKRTQEKRQKTKCLEKSEDLEKCTSLWAELTNIGLVLATNLRKQVMHIDLVIKVNSLTLAGKFHKKQ